MFLLMVKKFIKTNNWWCYGFIIYINIGQHLHVEMAKEIH